MDQEERAGWARRRRRRRALIAGSVAAAVLVAGGVVVVARSEWVDCRRDSTASRETVIDYRTDGPAGRTELAASLGALPGVGEALGSASLDGDVHLAAGAGGSLLIADDPYVADVSVDALEALDPATGEALWTRHQAGQAAAPALAGESVVSVAAVEGGHYRATLLDAGSGRVQRCLSVPREDDDGIGRAASLLSPGGEQMLIARRAGNGTELSALPLSGGDGAWTAELDGQVAVLVAAGDRVIAGGVDTSAGTADLGDPGPRWQGGDRVSLRAVDAATGAAAWTWPADVSDTATPQVAAVVPAVPAADGEAAAAPPLVIASVVAATDDADGRTSALVALDPATGEEVWHLDAPTTVRAVTVENVILADDGERTGAVDLATGTWRWSVPAQPEDLSQRLEIHRALPFGEDLLVPTRDGGLSVVDAATGEIEGHAASPDGALEPALTAGALAVTVAGEELLVMGREGA
ncbi:PQQ-like beta-propeller repeat protein [Brachybacterium sp. NBEC-018]|uniref:PQQ-like beta-propeller repeat protein n=1 Tax=Brachybacterium sp. NBEC-018 TaxID=2996004 RepID=UPI002174DA68|nr:PQQ-like beta-propeller repeat protein [Brachybacterium sp. NBEC-018]UVY85090.1 PQQ-like beta-propeller repeat protein [Brachybacterium sp. NBEC-018]